MENRKKQLEAKLPKEVETILGISIDRWRIAKHKTRTKTTKAMKGYGKNKNANLSPTIAGKSQSSIRPLPSKMCPTN